MSSKYGLLLSIKPEYCRMILSGEKTVELRRKMSDSIEMNTTVIIYSTSPVKKIVGHARVESVERMSVRRIWCEFGKQSGVPYSFFKEYFDGRKEGYALVLSQPEEFERPIPLKELQDLFGFRPPQSYMYLNEKIRSAISYFNHSAIAA
ncbi:MAG: ASCH domain-containing protein [Alphaproteobacteria bacterium]